MSENKNIFGSEIFLKLLPFFKKWFSNLLSFVEKKNYKFTNLTWFWTTFIHSTLCSRHLRTKACKEAGTAGLVLSPSVARATTIKITKICRKKLPGTFVLQFNKIDKWLINQNLIKLLACNFSIKNYLCWRNESYFT